MAGQRPTANVAHKDRITAVDSLCDTGPTRRAPSLHRRHRADTAYTNLPGCHGLWGATALPGCPPSTVQRLHCLAQSPMRPGARAVAHRAMQSHAPQPTGSVTFSALGLASQLCLGPHSSFDSAHGRRPRELLSCGGSSSRLPTLHHAKGTLTHAVVAHPCIPSRLDVRRRAQRRRRRVGAKGLAKRSCLVAKEW